MLLCNIIIFLGTILVHTVEKDVETKKKPICDRFDPKHVYRMHCSSSLNESATVHCNLNHSVCDCCVGNGRKTCIVGSHYEKQIQNNNLTIH